MKNLLTATAVIELGAGLALLALPSATTRLLVGAPLDTPVGLTVARVGGGGLLALGIACWLARSDSQSPAAKGLGVGVLCYDIVAAAVLAYAAIGYWMHGLALWPAVVLHTAMALWCVACLRPSSSHSGNQTRDSRPPT